MILNPNLPFKLYYENVDKFGRVLANNVSDLDINEYNSLCSENYSWEEYSMYGKSQKLLSTFYKAYGKSKNLLTTNINDENLIYLCESFEPSCYFKDFVKNIRPKTLEKIKNNEMIVVFNWCGEALYDGMFNSIIAKEFEENGLNTDLIFVLTSANNIKNTSKINYISDHFFLQNSANSLRLFLTQKNARNMNNDFDWNSEIVNYDVFSKNKSKHFISLNRQVSRPHRYGYGLFLEKNNLWNKGYFSFLHMMEDVNQCYETLSMNDFNSYGELHNSFKAKIPMHIDTKHLKNQNNLHAFRVSEIYYKPAYEDSIVNIVTETTFTNNRVFISEKTFHPIINLQPFIMISSNGHLAELRRLGFKTFDGFIDESYDMEENSQKRFKMICDEIIRLSEMDIEELNKLYLSYKEVYIHNRQHLLKFTTYDYFDNCLQKIKNICSLQKKKLL